MGKIAMEQTSLNDFLAKWHDENDFIVAHTSGSTGQPKPIRLYKADMIQSARATNDYFGIDKDSTLFTALSSSYIAGMMMIVRAEVAGARLEMVEPTNNFSIKSHVSFAAVVPSQIDCIVKYSDLVKNVLVGGAPLTAAQEQRLVESGIKAWMSYGMTETVSHVALRRVGDPDKVYNAMPGIKFSLHGDSLLSIDAPHMTFSHIDTNDRVQLIDNTHFRWLGRADNVINSGGLKFQIEEIEKELGKVLDLPFYIKGSPDEKWGQHIHLVVESGFIDTTNEHDKLDKIVRDAVERTLPHVMQPREITFVETIPRTSSGKIKRI